MFENLKLVGAALNSIKEEFDDLCRETRNDARKLGKEISEDFRHEVENKASNINYQLGQNVKNANKVLEKVGNAIETSKNLSPGGSKCNGEYYLGDHLYIFGIGGAYTHHAIYVENNLVIHYDWDKVSAIYVYKVTIEEFAHGEIIYKLTTDESPLRFSKEEAVRRAHSRLYEQKYNLLYNNCDTFVRWCRYGNDM